MKRMDNGNSEDDARSGDGEFDATRDLCQEDTFAVALVALLEQSSELRERFFAYHTGCDQQAASTDVVIRRKDRRHVSKTRRRIEIDVLLQSQSRRQLLAIELKGQGGCELPGQTDDIAQVVAEYFQGWQAVLLLATPAGTRAQNTRFRNITLDELVAPLRTWLSEREQNVCSVRSFIAAFERDYGDEVLRGQRQRRAEKLKRISQQLVECTRELLREHPVLSGLVAERERGYHRDRAEVFVQRSNWAWEGFHFAFTIRVLPKGELCADARLAKHGKKNVATLKDFHKHLESEPIPEWTHAVDRPKKFDARQLSIATMRFPVVHEAVPSEHLKTAIETLLVPAMGRVDKFLAGR